MFNWIYKILCNWIWWVFVQGPLGLIAIFNKVLEYLTGGIINDLLFGSSKEFNWSKIPIQFWWFVFVSLCIFSLIFTIQMIILIFQDAVETKTKFVLAIQNAVKAFCFMFLIPIFFFLANFIVQSLADIVINNFGKGDNIASYLWHIGDPTWDGTADGVPNDYSPPDNLQDYNMIAQIFGTWFMLFAIFIIGIILIQKIIELFFLFIISPVVMIVMVIDNGKAAFTWKDMVIAKFLASTATLIGYYIFISVTQILLSSDLSGLTTELFGKTLFIILFLCGGGLATIGFCNLIAAFVGESVGISEASSSFQSTIRGGMMAMGAGGMVKTAMIFTKNKLGKGISKLNSLSTNDTLSNDTQMTKSKLDFNPFQSATKTMASRSGIIGLAGLGLEAFGSSAGGMAAKAIKTFSPKKKEEIKTNTDAITENNKRFRFSSNGIKNNIKQNFKNKSNTYKKEGKKDLIRLNKKLNKYQNRRGKKC